MKKEKEDFEKSDDIIYIVMIALMILLIFAPKAETADFSSDPIVRELLRNPDVEADRRDDARKSSSTYQTQPVYTDQGFKGFATQNPDGSVYFDSLELHNRDYYNYGE